MKKILIIILTISLYGCGGGGDTACSVLKISNGDQCAISESAVVKLFIPNNNGNLSACTGTLITPSHILTAAHCFNSSNGAPVEVVLSSGSQTFSRSWRANGDYFTFRTSGTDVAVVEVDSLFTLGITPIPIGIGVELFAGREFNVAGFGEDESGEAQSQFPKATTMKVSRPFIRDGRGDIIFVGEILGGNTCVGDSGGPALLPGNPVVLTGIISRGTFSNDCLVDTTTVFGDTSSPSIRRFLDRNAPGYTTSLSGLQ